MGIWLTLEAQKLEYPGSKINSRLLLVDVYLNVISFVFLPPIFTFIERMSDNWQKQKLCRPTAPGV